MCLKFTHCQCLPISHKNLFVTSAICRVFLSLAFVCLLVCLLVCNSKKKWQDFHIFKFPSIVHICLINSWFGDVNVTVTYFKAILKFFGPLRWSAGGGLHSTSVISFFTSVTYGRVGGPTQKIFYFYFPSKLSRFFNLVTWKINLVG